MRKKWFALFLGLVACAGAVPTGAGAKAEGSKLMGGKCSPTKTSSKPLIVEWPSTERAALEARARRGLVPVRYVGCEMEVLPRCAAPGKYGYAGITRKRDVERIRQVDDLYGKIPVGAARLEGALQRSGELNVAMTVVGNYEADHDVISQSDLTGDCARATHVVVALSVGAFEMYAGTDAAVGADATVLGAGAGAHSRATHETLAADGSDEACWKATRKDAEAPEGCGAILRVEVLPIGAPRSVAAKPLVDLGSMTLPTAMSKPNGFYVLQKSRIPAKTLREAVLAAGGLRPEEATAVRDSWDDLIKSNDAVTAAIRKLRDLAKRLDECRKRDCEDEGALSAAIKRTRADEGALEKRERKKRASMIALLERVVAKQGASTGAGVLLALASLYDDRAQDEFLQAQEAYLELVDKGRASGPPPERQLDPAIALYRRVKALVDAGERIGWYARYSLAYDLEESARESEAKAELSELTNAPARGGTQEALFRLAEHEFDDRQFARAAPLYRSVAATPGTYQRLAEYKLAWAHFQHGDWAPALDSSVRLADASVADEFGQENAALAADCIEHLGGLDRAVVRQAKPEALALIFGALGNRAVERLDFGEAIRAYEMQLAKDPSALAAPRAAAALAALYERTGDAAKARAMRERLAKEFTTGSPWAKRLREQLHDRDTDIAAAIDEASRTRPIQLPPPPDADQPMRAELQARVRGLVAHCFGRFLDAFDGAQVALTVEVIEGRSPRVAAQASGGKVSLEEANRCLETDADTFFVNAPAGVRAAMRLTPRE